MELVFQVYVSDQIFRSDIDLQKSKKQWMLYEPYFFTRPIWCAVKIVEDFTEGNSRKSQMKS